MGKLIKKIKIKKQDGTFTDYIPIGAEANNIETDDGDSVQLKLNKKPYYYNTVADMKADIKLKNGDMVITLGYYSVDDGGGATYRITETESEIEYQEEISNGLYATLIVEGKVNVKQFGAYGDGEHDDTIAIQTTLNHVSDVTIPDGTYMVNAQVNPYPNSAILLNSGNRVSLDKNTIIKIIPNALRTYRIFGITDVENVEISGGTLEGDRDEHDGTAGGEWGHCISINGTSDNIYIHDIYLKDSWGDGISFGLEGRVKTENVHVDNVRRNGYSIIKTGMLISTNDFIENVGGETGTAPKDGIDIEPDRDTESVYVVFNNLTTKNNSSTGLALNHIRNNDIPLYIEVNNYHSEGDNRGISLAYSENAKGTVIINDAYIKDSLTPNGAIRIESTGKNYHIVLNRPIVRGYYVSSTLQAGIIVGGSTDIDSGNIKIINPTVIEPSPNATANNVAAIRFGAISNGIYDNVGVIDPIDLGGKAMTFNGEYINSIVSDKYNQSKYDADSNLQIGSGSYYSLVDSINYTANRTVTIKASSTIPIGSSITFINSGNYDMNILFEDQYIYPISSSMGKTLTLTEKGSSISIKRISSTEWIATNTIGNITSN